MRVKILNSYWSGEALETKVNDFLNELERKNQEKSIRETVPSFLRELIESTFSVPVNFSVSPTKDTHAKRRKCVDFLRDSIKSV